MISFSLYAEDKVELETLYLKATCTPSTDVEHEHQLEIVFNYIPSGPNSTIYQTGMETRPMELCETYDIELSEDGQCQVPYKFEPVKFDMKKTEASNDVVFYTSWDVDDGKSTYVGEKSVRIKKSLLNSLEPDQNFDIRMIEDSLLDNEPYGYNQNYNCTVEELINKKQLEKQN